MVKTITWVRLTDGTPDRQNIGTRTRVRRTITLTTDATTASNVYAPGGIPFTEATNLALANKFDLSVVERLRVLGPLKQALNAGAVPGTVLFSDIDLANLKLQVFGGATTAAEDVPLEEMIVTTALGDSKVWTAEVEAEGF